MASLIGYNRIHKRARKKMGRPTKYNEQVLEMCYDYVKNYESIGDLFPSVNGLVKYLRSCGTKLCRDTVMAWQRDKRKPEFSYMLELLSSEQERVVLNKAGNGEIKAQVALFILRRSEFTSTARHGYADTRARLNWVCTIIDPKLNEAIKSGEAKDSYTCINQKVKAQIEAKELSGDQDKAESTRVA